MNRRLTPSAKAYAARSSAGSGRPLPEPGRPQYYRDSEHDIDLARRSRADPHGRDGHHARDAASTHVDDLLSATPASAASRALPATGAASGTTKTGSSSWWPARGCLARLRDPRPLFRRLPVHPGPRHLNQPRRPHAIKIVEEGKEMEVTPDRFIEARVGGERVHSSLTRVARARRQVRQVRPGDAARGTEPGCLRPLPPSPTATSRSPGTSTPIPRAFGRPFVPTWPGSTFVAYLLMFPLIAAFIGLFIGAVDGMMCRLLRRALLAGAVGLVFGFVGGFLSETFWRNLVYAPLTGSPRTRRHARLQPPDGRPRARLGWPA